MAVIDDLNKAKERVAAIQNRQLAPSTGINYSNRNTNPTQNPTSKIDPQTIRNERERIGKTTAAQYLYDQIMDDISARQAEREYTEPTEAPSYEMPGEDKPIVRADGKIKQSHEDGTFSWVNPTDIDTEPKQTNPGFTGLPDVHDLVSGDTSVDEANDQLNAVVGGRGVSGQSVISQLLGDKLQGLNPREQLDNGGVKSAFEAVMSKGDKVIPDVKKNLNSSGQEIDRVGNVVYSEQEMAEMAAAQGVTDFGETDEGLAAEEKRQEYNRKVVDYIKQVEHERVNTRQGGVGREELPPSELFERNLFTADEMAQLLASGMTESELEQYEEERWDYLKPGDRRRLLQTLVGMDTSDRNGAVSVMLPHPDFPDEMVPTLVGRGYTHYETKERDAQSGGGGILGFLTDAFSRVAMLPTTVMDRWYEGGFEGKSLGGNIVHGLSGAGASLSGDFTTPGEMMQNLENNLESEEIENAAPWFQKYAGFEANLETAGIPVTPLAVAFEVQNISAVHGEAWGDRFQTGYSFFGEFAFDPTTYLGGKVATASKALTKEAAEKAASKSATNVAADILRPAAREISPTEAWSKQWADYYSTPKHKPYGPPVAPKYSGPKLDPKAPTGRLSSNEAINEANHRSVDYAAAQVNDPVLYRKDIGHLGDDGKFTGKSVVDVAKDATDEVLNNTTHVIQGGARKGTIVGLTDTTYQALQANRAVVEHAVRDTKMKYYAQQFGNKLQSGKAFPFYDDANYRHLVETDPFWKAYDNEFSLYRDDVLNASITGKGDDVYREAHEKAWNAASRVVSDQASSFGQHWFDNLMDDVYSFPVIKVAGKEVELKFLGKAYQGAAKRGGIGRYAPKQFSYDKQFPDQFGRQIANVRRHGKYEIDNLVKGSRFYNPGETYDMATDGLRKVARRYTKSQRQEISRAIDSGIIPSDPHIAQGVAYVKSVYAWIAGREITAGLRSAEDLAENYQYVWAKSQPKTAAGRRKLDNLRNARKDQAKGSGKIETNAQAYKDAGLKVIDDPFENLMYRALKSERDLGRSQVLTAFLDTYGIKSKKMDNAWAREHDLVPVGSDRRVPKAKDTNFVLDEKFSNNLKDGEQWYLPANVAEMYGDYYKMSSINITSEMSSFVRTTDRLMNMFKVSATVPYAGFHLKNMLGDIYMGALDGVNWGDYNRINKAITKNRRGEEAMLSMGKYDQRMAYTDIRDYFERYAGSGGFTTSDIAPNAKYGGALSTEGGVGDIATNVAGIPRRVGQGARNLSEWREDYGRFVHFTKAFSDELKNGNVKVLQVGSKELEQAASNAAWRVDKYKFDYGALTHTEKNVVRRIIPFYTYSRKALPIAVQSLFYNPGISSKALRFFDSSSDAVLPDWLQEPGFKEMPFGGDQPYVLSNNTLPHSQIGEWTGYGDPTNPGDFLTKAGASLLGRAGPLGMNAVEFLTNKDTFTGQPVSTGRDASESASFLDAAKGAVMDHMPVARDLLKTFGPRDNELIESLAGSSGEFWDQPGEEFLTNRVFVGGPLANYRATDDKQHRLLNSEMYQVEEGVQDYSQELKKAGLGIGLAISKRNEGASVRVTDLGSGNIIFDGDLQGAVNFVKQNFPGAPEFTGPSL